MEEWKVIENYPDYSISNQGKVKNNKTGKILKNQINKTGYFQIGLYKDKKPYKLLVHRLVAQAFLSDWDKSLHVDHINHDKINNNISNLRMATPYQNILNRRINKKINQYDKDMNLIATYDNISELIDGILKKCDEEPIVYNGSIWQYKEK